MNRFIAFLNSIPFTEFQQLDFNSRNKMQKLAWASLLPMMLYAGIGFGLASQLFQLGMIASLTAGIIALCVILIIEKLIMAQGGNWVMKALRLLMILIMSVLGSYLVDTFLFNSEIKEMLSNKQKATLEKEQGKLYATDPELQDLALKAEKIESKIAASFASFSLEMHGVDGRSKGYGSRAKTHEAREAQFEAQLEKVEQQMQNRREQLTEQAEATAAEQANGLLAQLDALERFMKANPFSKKIFWLIFGFLMLIESLVLSIKLSEKTPFEHAYATRNFRAKQLAKQRENYLK
ncbi:MAG: DUF4407 domain-containing protein [Schleiferiaceae bacterium]|nr:DUF4407 domain-containing protein [Schleiferiaceae bacterium]